MFQCVKLAEHNISSCSFHAISLEEVDFNGCMFIEMGMNQRWSCFLHRLYPPATQHVWFDCSAAPAHGRHAVIRCMHKWSRHALLVQLNGTVSTHPGYYSTNTTASVVSGCKCQTIQGRRQWYGRYGHGHTVFLREKNGVAWILTYTCVIIIIIWNTPTEE